MNDDDGDDFSTLFLSAYLNELYTRAFQSDQVPDVVIELAQLLPAVQLSQLPKSSPNPQEATANSSPSSSSRAGDESQQARLVNLYANMLMHCFNRTDDPVIRRLVQALAVVQPDVRDQFSNLKASANGLCTISFFIHSYILFS